MICSPTYWLSTALKPLAGAPACSFNHDDVISKVVVARSLSPAPSHRRHLIDRHQSSLLYLIYVHGPTLTFVVETICNSSTHHLLTSTTLKLHGAHYQYVPEYLASWCENWPKTLL
jgi:hypothetical protein